MGKTYYDSTLTDAKIQQVLDAINNILTPANNGKVLAISDVLIEARSVQWGGGYPEPTGTITLTENGLHDIKDYAEALVDVQGGSSIEVIPLTASSNGTYTAPAEKAYSPVTVDVSGGSISWKDQLLVNWDFANPVNTRGAASYGSNNLIYTIDGWQLQQGRLEFVEGGIKLSRYGSSSGYFMQRLKPSMTGALIGQTLTLSAIVDGVLYSTTKTVSSGTTAWEGYLYGGVNIRGYNYGSEIAWTIDLREDTQDHIIKAIKLEAGSSQTLATESDGAWRLNNSMDHQTEYIKARDGTVYNS